MKSKATLFNQVSGPLFIDIANSYSDKYEEVVLITGSIENTSAELNKNIKVILKAKYRRNRGYLRIFTWLQFFFQSLIYILLNKNNGKILLVSNPPLLPFLGLLKLNKFPFDILIYDVYPDALSNLGYINSKSLLFRFWDNLNRKVFQRAKRVITISEEMKNLLSRTASIDKVEVIFPWVDNFFIKPIKKNDNWFVKKHNLLNKKVVLYSGNMGLTHDLKTVLNAAKKLDNQTNNLHFLFIGDGAQKQKLIEFKIKNKLNNVTFLPFQKPEVLPFSIASADFGIVTLGKGADGLSIPSKTFYLLAAGVAIISISELNSELSNLINKNNCGISVLPSDHESLSYFIINVSDNDLKIFKENSRALSKKFTHKNSRKFL
jgi:glycosyltransferase involved in cell wall biosynthesis